MNNFKAKDVLLFLGEIIKEKHNIEFNEKRNLFKNLDKLMLFCYGYNYKDYSEFNSFYFKGFLKRKIYEIENNIDFYISLINNKTKLNKEIIEEKEYFELKENYKKNINKVDEILKNKSLYLFQALRLKTYKLDKVFKTSENNYYIIFKERICIIKTDKSKINLKSIRIDNSLSFSEISTDYNLKDKIDNPVIKLFVSEIYPEYIV